MAKYEDWDWLRDVFTYFIHEDEPLTSNQKGAKGTSKKKRVGHGS